MPKRMTRWWLRPLLAAVAEAILMAASFQPADAAQITKCGRITKPGLYTLKNDLSTASGDCLTITASKVTLDGRGHKITGGGSGIGIHIIGSGFVLVAVKGPPLPTRVTNFAIGIQDDGNGAFGDFFFANGNTDTGLLVNGASGSSFNTFDADNNGVAGVHLKSASRTVLFNAFSNQAGAFGFWFDSSSNNTAQMINVNVCGNTGVYLGCSSTGPGGQCTAGAGASTGNKIGDASVSGCATGIAIDSGNLQNVITRFSTSTSQDSNANCGSNVWFDNDISAAGQACEQ